MTYLDYNATAPILPNVIDRMSAVMHEVGNPSSVHAYGKKARNLVDVATKEILASLGTNAADIIFTGSGTEANNMALTTLSVNKIITSSIEHVSILEPAKKLNAIIIPVKKNGEVDLGLLEKALQSLNGACLVSIQLANNETGIIQPLNDVVQLVHSYKGYVHTDATQYYGKIELSFEALNVDMMTISAHKIGGPQGVGALIFKKGLKLAPMIIGGGQMKNLRAGTENVAGICGFAEAAKSIELVSNEFQKRIEKQLINFDNNCEVFETNLKRLPNTLLLRMPNVKSHTQLIYFDLNQVALSSGAACSSGKVESSHVLREMGVSSDISDEVIRLSYGKNTTSKEIDKFVSLWKKMSEKHTSTNDTAFEDVNYKYAVS